MSHRFRFAFVGLRCLYLWVLEIKGFFKDPLFLPERIKLCRDIGVETLKGGHHLHLEGA